MVRTGESPRNVYIFNVRTPYARALLFFLKKYMVTLTKNKIVIEIESQFPHHEFECLQKGLLEVLQNNWMLASNYADLPITEYGFAVYSLLKSLITNEDQLRKLFDLDV